MSTAAQEFSEKREIAVFNLSYYDWDIPNGALGAVDEQIRSVFVNLGRFEVLGMTYRLGMNDINEFIAKIKEYKESNVEIPDEVLAGKEAFTEADFNKLVGGFIVVVPSVSFYNLERLDSGDYKATIQTSFTVINVDELKTEAQFYVETEGIDDNQRNAVKEAVDAISARLTYEIRKVPIFQLKTGILEVIGGDVVMEFGNNMGVMPGDEYAVTTARVTSTGHTTAEEVGLLIIKEVREEYSVGQVIYSGKTLVVGDQLQEVPRFGVDTTIHAGYLFGQLLGTESLLVAGIRGSISRGFFSLRPTFGVDVPISFQRGTWLAGLGLLPINVYGGVEVFNLYLGRLQISPSAVVGIGTIIPIEEGALDNIQFFSHVGGKATLTVSYLLGRDFKLFIDAGFSYWFGVFAGILGSGTVFDIPYFDSYGGPSVGGGLTYKF
jgi:hypothetical protein